jgi:cytochrome c oxidase subunit 1
MTIADPAVVVRAHEPEHGPTGFLKWITSTDHKVIGKSYTITSLVFFCMAGTMAMIMRTQLASPDNTLVSQHLYN